MNRNTTNDNGFLLALAVTIVVLAGMMCVLLGGCIEPRSSTSPAAETVDRIDMRNVRVYHDGQYHTCHPVLLDEWELGDYHFTESCGFFLEGQLFGTTGRVEHGGIQVRVTEEENFIHPDAFSDERILNLWGEHGNFTDEAYTDEHGTVHIEVEMTSWDNDHVVNSTINFKASVRRIGDDPWAPFTCIFASQKSGLPFFVAGGPYSCSGSYPNYWVDPDNGDPIRPSVMESEQEPEEDTVPSTNRIDRPDIHALPLSDEDIAFLETPDPCSFEIDDILWCKATGGYSPWESVTTDTMYSVFIDDPNDAVDVLTPYFFTAHAYTKGTMEPNGIDFEATLFGYDAHGNSVSSAPICVHVTQTRPGHAILRSDYIVPNQGTFLGTFVDGDCFYQFFEMYEGGWMEIEVTETDMYQWGACHWLDEGTQADLTNDGAFNWKDIFAPFTR